jgi:hypothetical protein
MKYKKKKNFILFILVSILLLSTTVAYAYTEYWGSSTSYTSGPNKARQASYMRVWTNSSISARTIVKNDVNTSFPPGWLGVYPRAYYSTGNLAEAGNWYYSDGNATAIDSGVYVEDYTGYLYSQGRTALWGGTDYTRSTTTESPYARIKSNESNIMDIKSNSSGETYGSSLGILNFEDEPDLIAATGVDSIEGYVKKTDLYEHSVTSPEEALIFMKSKNATEVRAIPLYDLEGKKVIGSFEITPSKDVIETIIED